MCSRINEKIKSQKPKSHFARRKKYKTFTLALDKEDPERELEFELDFQASLSVQDRFTMMFRRSREIMEALIRHGHRKPVEITKRT